LKLTKCVQTAAGDASEVVKEIEFWFLKLVMLIFDSIKEIGNMIFRMVNDTGGLGSVVQTILKLLCEFANMVLVVWNEVGCVIMKNVTVPIAEVHYQYPDNNANTH
jgi:hypothetical protein